MQDYWAHNDGLKMMNDEFRATMPPAEAAKVTLGTVERTLGDPAVAALSVVKLMGLE
jgi:hypothetical protein